MDVDEAIRILAAYSRVHDLTDAQWAEYEQASTLFDGKPSPPRAQVEAEVAAWEGPLSQDQQGEELTGRALSDFLNRVEDRTGRRPEPPEDERDGDAVRRRAMRELLGQALEDRLDEIDREYPPRELRPWPPVREA